MHRGLWVDEAIFDQQLGREVDRILGQNWKALRRVVTAHVQLAKNKSWVCACKAEYRLIPTWYRFQNVYRRFLHSSEASKPDNGNNGEVPIPLSIDENDNVVYVMHERRRFVGSWSVVLERFVASDAAWVAIQVLWPNINFKANNAKVKGAKTSLPNRKLLQKCACRCTKGPGQPDEMSCRISIELIANLHKYYHDRNQWYKAAEECKVRVLTNGRDIEAVNPCM